MKIFNLFLILVFIAELSYQNMKINKSLKTVKNNLVISNNPTICYKLSNNSTFFNSSQNKINSDDYIGKILELNQENNNLVKYNKNEDTIEITNKENGDKYLFSKNQINKNEKIVKDEFSINKPIKLKYNFESKYKKCKVIVENVFVFDKYSMSLAKIKLDKKKFEIDQEIKEFSNLNNNEMDKYENNLKVKSDIYNTFFFKFEENNLRKILDNTTVKYSENQKSIIIKNYFSKIDGTHLYKGNNDYCFIAAEKNDKFFYNFIVICKLMSFNENNEGISLKFDDEWIGNLEDFKYKCQNSIKNQVNSEDYVNLLYKLKRNNK